MSRLFVCGDLHATYDIKKLNVQIFPEQKELTKEDVLVQLGDFGLLWFEPGTNKEQDYWINWLSMKNFTTLVIPGNHENYDVIENLPWTEMFGNKVQYHNTENGVIYFLKRGAVYNINKKKVWIFGGGDSIDKNKRIVRVSWWPQEIPSTKEFDFGMNELDKVGWKVDYVFTHTCPFEIIPLLGGYIDKMKDPVAQYLQVIQEKLTFEEWHFGHFHVDVRIKNFFCHYNASPMELRC